MVGEGSEARWTFPSSPFMKFFVNNSIERGIVLSPRQNCSHSQPGYCICYISCPIKWGVSAHIHRLRTGAWLYRVGVFVRLIRYCIDCILHDQLLVELQFLDGSYPDLVLHYSLQFMFISIFTLLYKARIHRSVVRASLIWTHIIRPKQRYQYRHQYHRYRQTYTCIAAGFHLPRIWSIWMVYWMKGPLVTMSTLYKQQMNTSNDCSLRQPGNITKYGKS